jgi:uncharacterized protein (DUF488 family)
MIVSKSAAKKLVAKKGPARTVVFTVGHSTRPIDDFLALLRAHGVRLLVDVRTIPRSRHNPQFNQDSLREALKGARIGYRHMKGLGGLRHARKDSPNGAWRNASFRGFADYMQTEEFAQNVDRLIELARKRQTAIMCAEAVPFRCHRSLIGDALLARHIGAEELSSLSSTRPHTLTPWARVRGKRVWYPPEKENV